MEHDRAMFDKPDGWQTRRINESPLIVDFDSVWSTLSQRYASEMPSLAYSAIPTTEDIAKSMRYVLGKLGVN